MEVLITTLVAKVRNALDDIAPKTVGDIDDVDDFSGDVNTEIMQALLHAATSLSQTLPVDQFDYTTLVNDSMVPSPDDIAEHKIIKGSRASDGSGYIELPADYLRFVSLKLSGWPGKVSELMEQGSDAEKRQQSIWGRGSITKPKAMLDQGTLSVSDVDYVTKILRYWPFSDTDSIESLSYIRHPEIITDQSSHVWLNCDLRQDTEKNLIYLACRIFLEGKKETATAEAFSALTSL